MSASEKRPERRAIDLHELGLAKAYFFLVSAIIPRPIAWVTTRTAEGGTNLAPFSFFQGVSADPPVLMIAVQKKKQRGDAKDTLVNIRATGEFVVNLVPGEALDAMVESSRERDLGDSEIEAAGLETFPAQQVSPPCLAMSPVALECRVWKEVDVGATVAIFGEILLVQAREDHLDDRGNVDPERLRPLARLGGSLYLPFGETVKRRRPG